jgi:peptidoglycan/LPS O-acetylase OafA/YrhL
MLSIYYFSYWALPGPLVFFFIGHFIYQRKWFYLVSTLAILVINHIHLIYSGHIARYAGLEATGLNLDIYVGLYFGVIAILFLKNLKPNRIDNWLGSISYGCFLCHIPVYTLFAAAIRQGIIHPEGTALIHAMILLSSCILGLFSFYCIEKPLRKYRNVWRFNNKMTITNLRNSESMAI